MKIDVIKRCARCGGNHKNVEFKKLTRPADDYTHWASCPNTGEPILMIIIGYPEPVDWN